MAAVPMSRDMMRELKAKTDENNRLTLVERYVKIMYESAINTARTSINTQWRAEFHNGQGGQLLDGRFIITNIDDILRRLQDLFPDCSVDFKSLTMARGPDGQMHDISTLDEKALMFIGNRQVTQCITIDWS
uniref:Uncharacterized protein n=1 Tax=viral metagenome TaxID=1070528 RepID=A0A6C0ANQ4_9ZZZZ